jgi:hypothetical protein
MIQHGQGGQRRDSSLKLSLRKFSLVDDASDGESQEDMQALFGRDAETSELIRRALSLKESVVGGATVFEGEAGSGKSALLAYTSEVVGVALGHSRVVQVEAMELQASSALSLFSHVLVRCVHGAKDIHSAELTAAGCEAMMERYGLDVDLVPLLSPMLEFEISETDMTAKLSSLAR